MNSWKSQHCLPVTPNCLHCLMQTVHYYCSYLPWFNNKSLKVLILFYMNSAKVVLVLVLVGSNSSECVCIIWYELWKKCLLLFYSKLLKVSVWFDMNSEKVFTVVFTHVFSSFFLPGFLIIAIHFSFVYVFQIREVIAITVETQSKILSCIHFHSKENLNDISRWLTLNENMC